MHLAPIALFAFNRPDHTRQTLQSLAANTLAQESELFIFCDGPRTGSERVVVERVRQVASSATWCAKVNVFSQEKNQGCASSVIQGVTQLCADYGRAIVIEDDLVLSPHFLSFMNAALSQYKEEAQVVQISGYMYPVPAMEQKDAGFLPFISSWGWATWQRAWQNFDPLMTNFNELAGDLALRRRFNLDDNYPYFEMLQAQRSGQIDSWAISWYLSTFFQNGLTLYPSRSLVANHGFDGTGTHCKSGEGFVSTVSSDPITKLPIVGSDLVMQKHVFDYLGSLTQRRGRFGSASLGRWLQAVQNRLQSFSL